MRDVQKLRDLLGRVEKATGPDTELDAAILMTFDPEGDPAKIMSGFFKNVEWELAHGGLSYRTENGGGGMPMPRYSASLDASIALVERTLPGWVYELYGPKELERALAVLDPRVGKILWQSRGATMPLAILSALLRALISQAEGQGQHG